MSDLNQNTESEKAKGNPPTHIAKVRHGSGEGATYEQIAAAWMNEKGAIYIKLHGTQVVSGFSLYAAPEKDSA